MAPVAHVPAPSHVEAAVCWFIVVSQLPAPQTVPAPETWHVPSAPVHDQHVAQLEVPQQKPSTH